VLQLRMECLLTPRMSYSQHQEDIRLHKALKHIPNGRYVDIGAYEPEFNSMTKMFYEDGWTGINVEPNPRAFRMLEEQRPHDTNIKAVVTYREEATLHLVNERGWSSMRKDVADAAHQHGMSTNEISVDCISLADVCEIAGEPIHFLKIDVEGTEDEVIASGDWRRHRPWIVIAEAYMPNTNKAVLNVDWEPYLLSRGYRYQMDDGLNRWYISDEMVDTISIEKEV
jgi:FkbM family methyltransferase